MGLRTLFWGSFLRNDIDYILSPSSGEDIERKDIIKHYLSEHTDLKKYVVIDTDDYKRDFPGRFLKFHDREISEMLVQRKIIN